jgi:epoxyqueuosine reductase
MSISESIKSAALEAGFSLVAIAPCTPPPYSEKFDEWLERGEYGEMIWVTKSPELRKDPSKLTDFGKSILTLGMNYLQFALPPSTLVQPDRGRFSMYGWGLDYHDLMWSKMNQLGEKISEIAGQEVKFKAFCDTGPLMEKPIAYSAGMGFTGKNSLLINRQYGSRLFLGEILLDLELEPDIIEHKSLGCGSCVRCIKNCPTNAIRDDYSINAGKCISYWTVEHRGVIPVEVRSQLGNWIFGCDICQNVCPFNLKKKVCTEEDHFLIKDPEHSAPRLIDLIKMTQTEFSSRFKGSEVKRAKRRGLLRNVAVAMGNWGSDEAFDSLKDVILNEPEPLIRGHAVWAISQLENKKKARIVLEKARLSEDDEFVNDEIRIALDQLV